jgi:hypothetical protein
MCWSLIIGLVILNLFPDLALCFRPTCKVREKITSPGTNYFVKEEKDEKHEENPCSASGTQLMRVIPGGCGKSTDTESKSTEPASNESTASAVPASAAPATQAPPAEVLTLKLAHGLPATSMTGQQYNAFCEALQEVSGGAVVVDQSSAVLS